MIKQLMILDGVMAVAQFRDDGMLVEGMGMQDEMQLAGLAKFAHDYKRIVQGNADQLSMFTQVRGWTPPAGWMVRGAKMTVCSVGNLVCLVDTKAASINEVMRELQDASHW
jgi:roadblock/LC7 domain-containing protein